MARERLRIYRATAEERARAKDVYTTIYGYLITKYTQAREQHVDNLSKRQQTAINLLHIAEPGDFIENIGCKMSGYDGWTYILDC